jgi:polyisoprenoid-binding protein YceI
MKTIIALAAVIGLGSHVTLEPDSKLWLQGDSTVRGFTCVAQQITSDVTVKESDDIATLVEAASVAVPVAKLDCGNGKMNEHMRKALKIEQNPTLEFKLNSYAIDAGNVSLKGSLKIAGTTKDIEITGTAVKDGDLVRVKAKKQIAMSEWGVKPPSLMLGTMKVKDHVTFGFDVALKP